MGVVAYESDNGTKDAVIVTTKQMAKDIPMQFASELDEVWWAILMDAIEFCSKTLDTGALASSIRVTEGSEMMSGATFNGPAGTGPARQPVVQGTSSGTIFDRSIIAGDASVINPKTGIGTDVYAEWIHDGHMMRDGTFWEGNPFLTDAMSAHEVELMSALDKAQKELQLTGEG